MIISVDHGNKSIKTPNALFTSGLIVSEGLQGFKTDYICWNNKYYTLLCQRIRAGKTGRCDRDLFRNKRSESGSAEAGRYDEEGKSRGIVPVFVEKEKRKA